MQPSDSLASFGRNFGSPRPRPTSGTGACSADCFGDRRVRLPTRQLRRWITGSPSLRLRPRKGKGLPGYWTVLFVRTVVQHPAGYGISSPLLLLEKIYGEAAIAFTENRTLGIRNEYSFRGHVPTARTLAYLRFAGLVTEAVARLTTRLGRAHPSPGGFRTRWTENEISWSHRNSSNPNRPAEPGRTEFPILKICRDP
jgi:hypothetical protein